MVIPSKHSIAPQQGTIGLPAVVVLCIAAFGIALFKLAGIGGILALCTLPTEFGTAAAIFLAAGGWGYLLLRKLLPPDAPAGLKAFTACGLGLWLLSTAMLAAGSLGSGLLQSYLWWPIIGIGAALAIFQARRRIQAFDFSSRFDGRFIVAVLLAGVVGIWLAGAAVPPGLISLDADSYDVLEYHLQLPRQFFDAQHVGNVTNNCYSYYPLGSEMLFLLGMVLRGGAYSGACAATLVHGLFGLAAVGAILTSGLGDARERRFSALLLATCPFVLYLSWLAMVELSQLFYLVLALLWLRQWLEKRDLRSAAMIGLALGGSCAVKYLSVGLIAGPILVVMFAASLRRGRIAIAHPLVAAIVCAVLFSPWLVRNVIYTGNPVFPLATSTFRRGHWSEESQQRFQAGHGAANLPPVPVPPGYKAPAFPSRWQLFYAHFIREQLFGPLIPLLLLLAIVAMIIRIKTTARWEWCLLAVLAIQLVVWAATAHDMPARFLVPAMGGICLMCGRFLSAFSRVSTNPLRRKPAEGAPGPWGMAPAFVLTAIVLLVNIVACSSAFLLATPKHPKTGEPVVCSGVSAELASMASRLKSNGVQLSSGGPWLLIGQADAFDYPADSLYATVFDEQPLDRLWREGNDDAGRMRLLQQAGVKYIWVNWSEIWRLANTYGFPADESRELFDCRKAGLSEPTLKQLEGLRRQGLRRVWDVPEGFVPRVNGEAKIIGTDKDGKPLPLVWPAMTLYTMPGQSVTIHPTTQPASQP